MKKVALTEDVMVVNGQKDEEEVEVMANNMSMEMKRGFKTSLR